MRVTNQFISTLNACTVYNEGVSRVVMSVACNANKTIEVLKKENKEKMLNYLDIPNNCIFSLSLSLSLSLTHISTLVISFLVYYVCLQVVARNDVSTKGFLKVSFVVSCFISYSTFSSNSLS